MTEAGIEPPFPEEPGNDDTVEGNWEGEESRLSKGMFNLAKESRKGSA